MTPAQYLAALERLSLTRAGAARVLGVDYRTSCRWAAGDRAVPPPAARLLRLVIALRSTFPWPVLAALLTGEDPPLDVPE